MSIPFGWCDNLYLHGTSAAGVDSKSKTGTGAGAMTAEKCMYGITIMAEADGKLNYEIYI
jgi:hypothetical protein